MKNETEAIFYGARHLNSLSQEEERGRLEGGRGVVEASLLIRRNPGTGTKGSRKVEEEKLEVAAKSGDYAFCWFTTEEIDAWEFLDQGMESRVYVDGDCSRVLKVMYNYLNFYDSPESFFTNKISLHNYLFPETKLELLGFTKTYGAARQVQGEFFAPVVRQTFIPEEANVCLTEELICEEMQKRGFVQVNGYYANRDYIIKDLHLGNVLYHNHQFFFIDTVPSLNEEYRCYGDGALKESNSF